MYYYANEIIQKMKKEEQLIIFGAGNIARLVLECLLSELYRLPVKYCLVSDMGGNPEQIKGIPVIDYTEAKRLVSKDALILIAMSEKHLESAVESLCFHGYQNIIPLTFENDLWSLLRGNYYRAERLSQKKQYLTVEEELERSGYRKETGTISVYTARCHVDRALKEDISRFCWEIPIQVGAALTKERICDICDDVGEHISEKNRQYCELTALYCIWKNDRSDYVGLGHYRRHFELTKEQLGQLAGSDIDVVLTIPIMDIPNVEAVYRRDHIGADWDVMLEAVRTLSPEYVPAVQEMQSGKFYYAYNMFIIRREILEDYCSWLFPILFYCEKRCGEKEDIYQNRYIGFIAEHLMSVYFLYHEKDYKIVHARKHFIL